MSRIHQPPVARLALGVGALLLTAVAARTAPPTEVYAITGARIEAGNGQVIEKGTVLLGEGLITAVGEDVTVPPGAEIVDGKGLTVYPGFVDAYATRGLRLPEWQPVQDVPADTSVDAPASLREANRKGVRPELRAADALALTEGVVVPDRQGGFTSALIAPSGGTLNGVSALVNLGGRPRRESVIHPAVAQHVAFATTGPGYPGSLMGIFAHFRQTMLDAQHFRSMQAAWSRGAGIRPPADETLLALQPILDGKLPVVFEADTENEIRRALKLADEFKLKPWIAGGQEAWKVAPLLAEKRVPVLLAAAYGPEPGARRPMTPAAPGTPAAPPAPTTPPGRRTDDETPESVISERKAKWKDGVAGAAVLHKAGVPFAFTTRGTRGHAEFWANVRKAMENGLPKSAAVEAVTTAPSKLFGVERQVGTIVPGQIANLTILSGDFAAPTAKVRYLFIEGRKHEPEKERVPTPMPVSMRPMEDDHDHPHH